jgi:hypothetical protein
LTANVPKPINATGSPAFKAVSMVLSKPSNARPCMIKFNETLPRRSSKL